MERSINNQYSNDQILLSIPLTTIRKCPLTGFHAIAGGSIVPPAICVQSPLKSPVELKVAIHTELSPPYTTICIALVVGFHAIAGAEMRAPAIWVQSFVSFANYHSINKPMPEFCQPLWVKNITSYPRLEGEALCRFLCKDAISVFCNKKDALLIEIIP